MIIIDDGSLSETITAKEVFTDDYLYRFVENIQADRALMILVNILFLVG